MSLLNIIKYLWTSLYNLYLFVHYISLPACVLGYEPADLNVHPPPQQKNLSKVGSFLSHRCLVFVKNVPKEKSVFFGDIQVKDQKVVFEHIHSNHILIKLTSLDDNA